MQKAYPAGQKLYIASTSSRVPFPAYNKMRVLRWLMPLVTPMIILFLWHIATSRGWVAPFLLPEPAAVAEKFHDVLLDGRLWEHLQVTLMEVLAGLGLGVSVGVILGYIIARQPLMETILSPLILVFQATPVVAYAPLLVIWFGAGSQSKIVTSVLVVFFPMLMNTVVGVRGVPQDLRDLMRVSRANFWQTVTKLEIPAAMPVLLTGLKTSATLAVIGAVVGEFIVANAGLGFMINQARQQYDTPLVYVGVMTLTLMAGVLYSLIGLMERRALGWQHRDRT